MYVYQVTHLPTREFYIGLSDQPRSTFDPVKWTDPAGMFKAMGDNGAGRKIHNCEKRMLAEVYSMDELSKLGAEYAKKYQNVPAFKGLHSGKPTTLAPKPPTEQKAKATVPTTTFKPSSGTGVTTTTSSSKSS